MMACIKNPSGWPFVDGRLGLTGLLRHTRWQCIIDDATPTSLSLRLRRLKAASRPCRVVEELVVQEVEFSRHDQVGPGSFPFDGLYAGLRPIARDRSAGTPHDAGRFLVTHPPLQAGKLVGIGGAGGRTARQVKHRRRAESDTAKCP